MNRLLIALVALWLGLAPASAQNEYPSPAPGKTVQSIVVMCLNGSGQAVPCSLGTPLQVTGTFSASIGGFQGSGLFATLTATGSSSASTALPTGTTVNISNTGTTAVSCTFATGAATGVTNNLIVQPSSSRSRVVGSFDHVACIDQTGSVSNVIVLEGGTGLGNDSGGGGSSGGGGGGAVTLAATAVSSGAYVAGSIGSGAFASGSVSSGAFASGALSSGSIASGAFASGSIASGAFASGSIGAGAQVDLLTMRGTKAPGTAAANSLLAGCVYTAAGVSMADGQQVACQTDVTGNIKVSGIGIAKNTAYVAQTGSTVMGLVNSALPTGGTDGNLDFTSLTTARALRTDHASVNGTTALAGSGATGAGSPRVTQAIDQATNAGAALVKGGVGVVNGGSTYQAVAASSTATVLQTSTGAIGDYLSHCVIYPATTSPGVVTVFDNTNAAAGSAILFAGGASSVSNLAPIPIPVGAVSIAGAWKATTGLNVSIVCYGRFS